MGAAAVVLLLPPSEGKAPGGDGEPWSCDAGVFGSALAAYRAEVVGALAACGGGDARLLGVKGAHLDRAVVANRLVLGSPTLPAWRRYTGVVAEHLDAASLPAAVLRRAARNVLVFSGLLGVCALGDPVPDYRLKMGAGLAPLGRLSTWWRPVLSEVLAARLAGTVVVDLLPDEHAAAWDPAVGAAAARRYLRPALLGPNGRAAGHAGKAAKGLLARQLLLHPRDPLSVLAGFSHPDVKAVL